MRNFEELILGHWLNKHQAFSNPRTWPMIHLRYTKVEDGVLEFKSWYNYLNDSQPYRHNYFFWRYETDGLVRVESVNLLDPEKKYGCPYCIVWDGEYWAGKPDGPCVSRGLEVESTMKFNDYEYFARDAGRKVDTGELVWGKEGDKGEFHFKRVTK